MSQVNPSPDKPSINQYTQGLSSVALIGGEIGCMTLFIVLVGVFAGNWLDGVLGTKPLFILLFVLGSAPLALALTYMLAMRAVKNLSKSYPTARESQLLEEESPRE